MKQWNKCGLHNESILICSMLKLAKNAFAYLCVFRSLYCYICVFSDHFKSASIFIIFKNISHSKLHLINRILLYLFKQCDFVRLLPSGMFIANINIHVIIYYAWLCSLLYFFLLHLDAHNPLTWNINTIRYFAMFFYFLRFSYINYQCLSIWCRIFYMLVINN